MAKRGRRKVAPKRSLDGIQIAAIVIILLVAVGFAWRYIPRSQPSTPAELQGGTACEAFASIPAAPQYGQAPPMVVDPNKQYFANFKIEKGGEFVAQLLPDKAPIAVNSFVFLTCKGFFDGLTFHRVLEGFMAQAGDPTGTGTGGPGYEFVNEESDLRFDQAGLVAMANHGPDTNGSQFFITFGPAPHLDGGYTIFGQVIEGMDVVSRLTLRDPQQNPTFTGDAIESVTITEQ